MKPKKINSDITLLWGCMCPRTIFVLYDDSVLKLFSFISVFYSLCY